MALPIKSSTRQKMLKDFLMMEDDLHYSISSREFFRSLPQKMFFDSTIRELITLELKPTVMSPRDDKTRRPRAASATMLALQTVVKAVKAIPRTLSKQRNGKTDQLDAKMAVTIKDIIGWTSFRDPQTPLSPAATSSSSSKGSSWCDSDFTADYSPPWCGKGNNGESDIITQAKLGENLSPYVGEDYMEKSERSFSAMEMEPKKHQIDEDGDGYCSFSQCTSDADQIQEQEQESDRAMRLLNEVKASIPSNYSCSYNVDWLLLDFFMIELNELGSDHHLVNTAVSWLMGNYDISLYKWGLEGEGSGYIRDMDRGRQRWSGSEEEQDEVVEEIEGDVLSLLVDQLMEEALLEA